MRIIRSYFLLIPIILIFASWKIFDYNFPPANQFSNTIIIIEMHTESDVKSMKQKDMNSHELEDFRFQKIANECLTKDHIFASQDQWKKLDSTKYRFVIQNFTDRTEWRSNQNDSWVGTFIQHSIYDRLTGKNYSNKALSENDKKKRFKQFIKALNIHLF